MKPTPVPSSVPSTSITPECTPSSCTSSSSPVTTRFQLPPPPPTRKLTVRAVSETLLEQKEREAQTQQKTDMNDDHDDSTNISPFESLYQVMKENLKERSLSKTFAIIEWDYDDDTQGEDMFNPIPM